MIIKDISVIETKPSSSKEQESCQSIRISGNKISGTGKKIYIESYGCQMNFSDSEIVSSIMAQNGYDTTSILLEADVIFLNTCSIREKAEQTIRNRLARFNSIKKENPGIQIGLLGCMAERLKEQLLEEEKIVDLIAGPDAYRDLPNLVEQVSEGKKAVNVILSKEETYEEIEPVRCPDGPALFDSCCAADDARLSGQARPPTTTSVAADSD